MVGLPSPSLDVHVVPLAARDGSFIVDSEGFPEADTPDKSPGSFHTIIRGAFGRNVEKGASARASDRPRSGGNRVPVCPLPPR